MHPKLRIHHERALELNALKANALRQFGMRISSNYTHKIPSYFALLWLA